MVQMSTGKHLNMDAIVLESEQIEVKVLPNLGFKVASILHKSKNKEFLFQPIKGSYQIPQYGDNFQEYDRSGLDEMIPTIVEDKYPIGELEGRNLPDHGDVWSIPWKVELLDNKVVGNVSLRSLPLEFTKSISFSEKDTIRMDYTVKNLSKEDIHYIWVLHGLNVFDNDTEFIFQDDMNFPINIYSNEDLEKINLKYLKDYKDNRSYKYYFWGEIKNGEVGLDYKKDRIKYLIKYDTKIHPYLGVWVTKGEFNGEYNCCLGPSNGFYDSVSLSYENNRIPLLKRNDEEKWTIFIEIKEY